MKLTVRDRFEAKITKPDGEDGCWAWQAFRGNGGRGRFRLGGRYHTASRVAWELYRGPIPNGLWVLHRCDNRMCVNPSHLFLGTHISNMHDMVAKRRSLIGERNTKAKLTAQDVLKIRATPRIVSHAALARQFGVSQCTIYAIRSGKTWAHVKAQAA